MSIKKDIMWRVGVVYIVVLLFGLFIIGKVLYLQTVEKKIWSDKARKLTMMDITIEPNRGEIYDSKNRLLATSVPYYEVRMDTKAEGLTQEVFRANVDSLALCLSKLFNDKTKGAYKSEIVQAWKEGKRFYLLQRKVNYSELRELKKFPLFRLGKNSGGLLYVQDNRRFQPNVNLASRTIGYLTKGETGNVVGIEGGYDKELRGVKGIRLMQKISSGVWMPVHDDNEVEPQDGKDIITTIDSEVQDVAENALLKQLTLNNADHGCAILMEVKTGEIKAIANLERDDNGKYLENYNYAIGESTEPGSTFKLMSLLAAFEDGYVELNDTVDTGNGVVFYYDKKVADHEGHGLGKITVQQVFENSSNVGVSKIITKYYHGKERQFVDHINKVGLNRKLNLEINGEGEPLIKYPGDKYWSGVSLPMMSYGYEVKLTPLQILTFYNAIANDGKMVKPRFVKAITYHGDVIENKKPVVLNSSVCSGSTLAKLKTMLEGVVERGTAKNLKNSIYKIAGKTGTAQIANTRFGYKIVNRVSYQASFVGYFPAENPRYSCIVVVNAPSNGVYYGNMVAGPVFKEISDKVFATSLDMHLEINNSDARQVTEIPSIKNGYKNEIEQALSELGYKISNENEVHNDWVSTKIKEGKIELASRYINKNLIPNVVDMGAKDAVFLLENLGLQVTLRGRGKVKTQSLPAGTSVRQGDRIILDMNYM
jgi:cell division protein FtsI (penicillin-binding protein 3)